MRGDMDDTASGRTNNEGMAQAQPDQADARFGGFPIDRAARHLSNFYADVEPIARDLSFFRTTRASVVAARRWRKLANDRIRAVGQSMARWETMYLLACSDDALNQTALAKLLGVEGPTMVRMLDVLEKDGLITRQQSKTDRRVTNNEITEKGREATRDIMAITNELREELLRDIDPAKLAVTLEVLEQIHAKLDDLC